jgi:hypothetical protein
VTMYYGDSSNKFAQKWYRSSKEVWNMFPFIFLLLLQFSHCTCMRVIFVTKMMVLMLAFWSDWDPAVVLFNAHSTHVC